MRIFTIPHTLENNGKRTKVETEHVLSVKHGSRTPRRYGIGGVPRGDSGRQEHGGPLVPGPWAFVFELGSTIDNAGGTGAEIQRNRAAGIEHDVQHGDFVRFDGCLYEINVATGYRGDVTLEPVTLTPVKE